MYSPRTDVTRNYKYVPVDFAKHLFSTTLVVAILAILGSLFLKAPVLPALKIQTVAKSNPVLFETTAMGDLSGTGAIASYGPPYNNGTGSVQSGLQSAMGVLYPVNAKVDFVLKPLSMEAQIDPSLTGVLNTFNSSSAAQQQTWETNYTKALQSATVVNGNVVVAPGNYGPVQPMMAAFLNLGKSGMLTGALDRSKGDYAFNNMNSLLFVQGDAMHLAAKKLSLLGEQWGIIHEEQVPYPGPWWMTLVTGIYQIPIIANAAAADALALASGLAIFVVLLLVPWIPGLNKLPRLLGVYRLIWREYYKGHQAPDPQRKEVRRAQ